MSPAIISYAIRLSAMVYGSGVILAGIALVSSYDPVPGDYQPPVSPTLLVPAFACLLASGFLYVAVAGRRLASARRHRLIAGVLLVVPVLWGGRMVIHVGGLRDIGLLFMVPALLALAGTVWPWNAASGQAAREDLPAER